MFSYVLLNIIEEINILLFYFHSEIVPRGFSAVILLHLHHLRQRAMR